MSIFKRIIFYILPQKQYLWLMHYGFFILYNLQILRFFPEYSTHYWVRKLIRKWDIIIDIGANLWHYTHIFAELTGVTGHVYAVEPVVPFQHILQASITHKLNISLLPYALWRESKSVTLGILDKYKYLRTGLPTILENISQENMKYLFHAEMRAWDELFRGLTKCHYIKIDVEGYELHVLKSLQDIISKFTPILQVEVQERNWKEFCVLMQKWNYWMSIIHKDELMELRYDDWNSEDIICQINKYNEISQ